MTHADHRYRAFLSQAVRPVLRLLVVRGVPIRIRKDDGIRGLQVNTEPTRPCATKVHEVPPVALVEQRGFVPASGQAGAAVQPQVREPPRVAKLLQHIQHQRELRKDQNLVPARAQAREHGVQGGEFPT